MSITPMLTKADAVERRRLNDIWARGRASRGQIERCMRLDRKAEANAAIARAKGGSR